MSLRGHASYLPLSPEGKVEVQGRGKKRHRSDVDVEEASYSGPRPQNAVELSNWLEVVQHYDGVDGDALDLREYSSLAMLLDPDFAFDWTPACTKEFRSLIVASGVLFEVNRNRYCSGKGIAKAVGETQCCISDVKTGETPSSPTISAEDIVDLNSDEGGVIISFQT